jgi:hypothetical protein
MIHALSNYAISLARPQFDGSRGATVSGTPPNIASCVIEL